MEEDEQVAGVNQPVGVEEAKAGHQIAGRSIAEGSIANAADRHVEACTHGAWLRWNLQLSDSGILVDTQHSRDSYVIAPNNRL